MRPLSERYCSSESPRRSTLRARPFSSSRVRTSTSGPSAFTPAACTSVSTAALRNCPSSSSGELLAQIVLEVGAQLFERVELADLAREVVVERRQHLLVDLLHLRLDRARLAFGDRNLDGRALARAHADERALELRREASAAELDDVVASRVARHHEIEDEDVARLRRPSVDRREVGGRRLHLLQRLLDELGGNVGLRRRHLERRPVGKLGLGLHRDRRREAPVARVAVGKLVAELGLLDRVDARLRSRVPEPAADVALDRLGVETLLADALLEHRQRHLALAEARNLDAVGEVGCGVVDGVLDVGAGHVDRQANLAVTELFDLRLHARPLEQTASSHELLAILRGPLALS